MYYPECDHCVKNYPELEPVIIKMDKILENLPPSSIILPEIFAQNISEKVSKVSGLFEILCDEKLLVKKKYFECPNPHCEHRIEISQYEKAMEDGDLFECPMCQINLTKKKLKEIVVFRFNQNAHRQKKAKIPFNSIQQIRDFKENETISILFLSADPSAASRLRIGEEFREIQEKITLAKQRDFLNLKLPQLSLRPQDVSQAMLDFQPHIVHFSGHGSSDGALCFENTTGGIHLVEPDALAALFNQFTPPLMCVLLNACYSEVQAKTISKHVKYVIGMNQAIGDRAAIAYAVGFYQALGAGRNIENAHKLGGVQIRLETIPEYQTPVLYKNGELLQ